MLFESEINSQTAMVYHDKHNSTNKPRNLRIELKKTSLEWKYASIPGTLR